MTSATTPERSLFALHNRISSIIRWCAFVGALVAGVPAAVSAQQATSTLREMAKENDARVWQAVGRLDAEEIGFCTATLISPEFVLTAAHCVYSRETGAQIPSGSMTFRAGLRNGNASAERAVVQVEAHPGYDPANPLVIENVRYDVALLRLAEPVPTTVLDPFVVHDRPVSSGPVSVVSYGMDREKLPSRQDLCEVQAARDGIMVMNCDATFGSSGAPVFRHVNGRGQIVSVISGGGTYNGQQVTYGMVLPKLVRELKQRMWANKPRPVATISRVQVSSGTSAARDTGAKFVRP